MQTKTHSLIESIINVLIGYGIAVASQIIIFPLFDIHIPLKDNFKIGLWFTVISIIRSYMVRRYFTKRTENETQTQMDEKISQTSIFIFEIFWVGKQ